MASRCGRVRNERNRALPGWIAGGAVAHDERFDRIQRGGPVSYRREVASAELGGQGSDALLYVGPAPTDMLRVLGPKARRVVGLSDSRQEVQRARAHLHGAGLAHCLLQHGDLQSVASQVAAYDAVVVDRALGRQAQPERLLADAARALRPGGRLVIVEDYETLATRAAADNPLAALRDWLARGGLVCARLRPVDVGGAHLIVATAAPEPGQAAA